MYHVKASNAETKTFTYQTRVHDIDELLTLFLKDYAQLYGKIERKLFADYARGLNIAEQKSIYLKEYGITARQFNAIHMVLQGKIDSIKALQSTYIADTKSRIKKVEADIKYLSLKQNKTKNQAHKLHQKRRLVVKLKRKLKKLEYDRKHNKIRLCFGGKKVFKQQFNLQQNQYANHEEWKQAWEDTRSNQFYFIGSKDETLGNQSCMAVVGEDGTISLRIRVPDCLRSKYGNYIQIPNLKFAYGQTEILAAINSNLSRNAYSKKAQRVLHQDLYKKYGRAISYRLLKDDKGWRVFVTCDKVQEHIISDKRLGAIGVDINIDHLAVCEIDNKGNLVSAFKISLCTYGKSRAQAEAIIGDAVKVLVTFAALKQKPIVLEKLDFNKKKRELAFNSNKRANRQLSSFAYSQIIQTILSKAFKFAIEVYQVNPAYSSVIGRVKFARIYSISVHQSAAMVIARRLFGFSERLPHCWDNIPNNTGGRVTLPELVKIQVRHVWHSWAKVRKNLQTAYATQFQMSKQGLQPYALAGPPF